MLARVSLVAIALLAKAHAHMQLYNPPPFMAYNNPHTPAGQEDDELDFPYDCCGEKTVYPCRGYLSLLGTPAGASVASWPAGSQQHMEMVGPAPLGGNHYGGSCQVSFSIDKGNTFRVAKSWEGDCPLRHNGELDPSKQDFSFNVPSDLPTGDAVFAWTWINREQEFFMNCAAVTITSNATSLAAANNQSSYKASSKASSSTKSATSSVKSSSSTKATSSALSSKSNTSSPSKASTLPTSSVSVRGAVASVAATTSAVPVFGYSMYDGCVCSCPSLHIADDGDARMVGCNCDCPYVPDLTKTTILPAAATSAASGDSGDDGDDSDDGSAASSTTHSHHHHHSSSSSTSTVTSTYTRSRLTARATPAAGQSIEARAAAAAAFVPFSSRPLVFVGNINGCMTPHTYWELQYPNPGPDVQFGDGEYELRLPTGTCS